MSKTEDYLDSLLNNVSSTKKVQKKSWESLSENLIEDFEKELNDADMEDFIRKFEIDVDTADDVDYSEGTDDSFFEHLEGIVQKAKEDVMHRQQEPKDTADTATEDGGSLQDAGLTEEKPAAGEAQESEEVFQVNTLEDEAWTNPQDAMSEEAPGAALGENKELLDMLAGLPSDEELSNLGEMLRADDEKYNSADDEKYSSEDAFADAEAEDEKQTEEKKGVFQKVKDMLFGEKTKEAEEEVTEEVTASLENEELSGMTEESLQILQELGAVEKKEKEPVAEPKDEEAEEEAGIQKKKEEKLRAKQEKKEKRKEEREKRKAEKKAKKENKPKKPKEVDLTPPLPRKPVYLIFLMGASVIFFVILAANYLGYSLSLSTAKEAYAKKDYVEAYNQVAGLELKEQDVEFSDKVLLLAKVQGELNNGKNLYDNKKYTMALDSYICALGRYDANYREAESSEIQKEYDDLAEQITAQMSEKFGVSAETAREIYRLRDRTEYTYRLQELVAEMGLTE